MPAPNDPLACPDLIAERRYAYGHAAAGAGDFAAAADMFEQALERAPGWAPALFALGEAREKLGLRERAAEAFRDAAAADPSDALAASARLKLLDPEARLDGLPRAYVARLFDAYAERFDAHLGALAYRGPALVVEALDAVAPGRSFACALDLGCGTGLAGVSVRGRVGRLEGVDLSAAMIERARGRGLYDALAAGDAVERLAAAPRGAFDLILAAHALCYFGDLGPLFAAGRRALARSGLLVVTVETCEGPGFRLLAGLRFAHSAEYLEAAAGRAGLRPLLVRRAAIRREAGDDAPGLVAAFSPD